ncbi:MAG: response regulator transcription factor [Bryobacterales bacterium]|nr:response regulator transcription factor [Bryobacterales bacterium]
MIRVALAAPSAMARAGLSALLAHDGLEIIGTAPDLPALSALIEERPPDVAVISLDRQDDEPPSDLLQFTTIPLVLLLDDPQPPWTAAALRAGVKAVLPADSTAEELQATVQAAAAGLIVLHPNDTQPVLISPTPHESSLALEPLTPRETEVLRLLSHGLGNKEIAARLHISEHTVKFHVAAVMGKLGAGTRTEAVTIGLRQGLILL